MSAYLLTPNVDVQPLVTKRGLNVVIYPWDLDVDPSKADIVSDVEDAIAIPGQIFTINGTPYTYLMTIPTLVHISYLMKVKIPYDKCNRYRRRH